MECCHPAVSPAASLAALFATGLLISLGHCLGMCGPLVSAHALAQRGEGSGRWAVALAAGRYHLGRLACYVLLGGALGLVGALVGGPERARVLTGVVSGVAGLAAAAADRPQQGTPELRHGLAEGGQAGAVPRPGGGVRARRQPPEARRAPRCESSEPVPLGA